MISFPLTSSLQASSKLYFDFSDPLPFAYTLDIKTEPNNMDAIRIEAMLPITADLVW